MPFLRYLPLLFFFCAPGLAQACSCGNAFIPLDELVCRYDTIGGQLLEIVLLRKDEQNTGIFKVETVHFGSTTQQEITLSAFHSCAKWIGDERLGQRFLYFSRPTENGDVDGDLFECGFNSNLFRMDNAGNQVDYPFPGNSSPLRNAGLRFQAFQPALENGDCGRLLMLEKELAERLPLLGLRLTNNPGNGQLELFNTKGAMPPVEKVEIYDATARRVAEYRVTEQSPLAPFDVSTLPLGIYYVFIRDARTRKMLVYVKSQ